MTRAEQSRQQAEDANAKHPPVVDKIVELCHEAIDEAAGAGNRVVNFRLVDAWIYARPTQDQLNAAVKVLMSEGYGVGTFISMKEPIRIIW